MRISASLLELTLGQADGWVWTALLLGAALLALGAWALRIRHRLGQLHRGIERITAGQVDRRLPTYDSGRIGSLSRALNRMAEEFNQRLRSIRQQRNEVEAVLSSMIEGVVAVDLDERLMSINRAAAQLLNLNPSRDVGRSIQEVIRNTAVQNFVAQALVLETPTQADLVLRIEGEAVEVEDPPGREASERFLQAQGTPMRDASGSRIGALIVLHDVTRLRRLEMVRRDFVANVSHELKTPITAIKGSVETLLDSSDSEDRESVHRFLQIILRQADRLNAIVEDLLMLARVEQDTERDSVELSFAAVKPVLEAAVEACALLARHRDMRIELNCPSDLQGNINPALLEQAVVNLLDNAIKYSAPGKPIRLAARRDGEIVIEVRDEGVGIEPEHIPRLFERFYRTDKARSRAQGGTGLGLAIVKHIANAHGGRVGVESQLGRGSTFRIHLPG